MHHEPLS
jgi:elongation factor 1-alpha